MTNIDIIHDRMTRKLTASARKSLQHEYAGLPGIPPVAPHITRKEPELMPLVQQELWSEPIIPYARYCADWQKVCAILPAYLLDGTNGTHVYYTDGTCDVLANRITWVLDDLLDYMLTSKEILARHSVRWMGGTGRRRVPLVVNDTFALVPVTCRVPQRRNDGATGYVVLQHIHEVLPGHVWRSRHRDEEDLLSDYDNVLNRPKTIDDEVSILILKPDADNDTAPYGNPLAKPIHIRDTYKLALRDSAATVQSNIYLAHQVLGVREYTLWDCV